MESKELSQLISNLAGNAVEACSSAVKLHREHKQSASSQRSFAALLETLAERRAKNVANATSRAAEDTEQFRAALEEEQHKLCLARFDYHSAGGKTALVIQPRVAQQFAEGECGYYALHNAIRILMALTEPDEAKALAVLDSAFDA